MPYVCKPPTQATSYPSSWATPLPQKTQADYLLELDKITAQYPKPNYYYSTYTPTVESASVVVTPKKIVWPPISKEDKKAPDFIVNKTVPMVVDRIFNEVFGRKPDKDESGYWKARARHDKATETKLRKTMQYFQSKGWTYMEEY